MAIADSGRRSEAGLALACEGDADPTRLPRSAPAPVGRPPRTRSRSFARRDGFPLMRRLRRSRSGLKWLDGSGSIRGWAR